MKQLEWQTDFRKARTSMWPILLWSNDFTAIGWYDWEEGLWRNSDTVFEQQVFTHFIEVVSPIPSKF
jgi:hypothetical protein